MTNRIKTRRGTIVELYDGDTAAAISLAILASIDRQKVDERLEPLGIRFGDLVAPASWSVVVDEAEVYSHMQGKAILEAIRAYEQSGGQL